MSLALHPNKANPKRYRVYNKSLGVQEYFPLTKKGLAEAKLEEKHMRRRLEARRIAKGLAINRIFNDDGTIKGMKRTLRKRAGKPDREIFYLCVDQRTHTERLISDDFDKCYYSAIEWILRKKEIEMTSELKSMFRSSRRHYWTSIL